MSLTGLGCVKTPAPAASVENLKAIAHYELRSDAMSENRIFHISPMYETTRRAGRRMTVFGTFWKSRRGLPVSAIGGNPDDMCSL